ncbi:MAG: hypothetical protein AAGJ34_03760 [Pseudomonadota bacterium]
MKVFLVSFAVLAGPSFAGPPVVEAALATSRTGNQVKFDVTLSHGDTGWDHYADGWGVYSPDGTELGYRTLFHPHVNEQPFTRSLTITLPEGITEVLIRPRDNVHGVGEDFILKITD